MSRMRLAARWFRYRFSPVLQVIVFLAAASAALALFLHRAESFSVAGLAQGRLAHVVAPYAARIKTVPVRLFQAVREGDVVAVLDDTFLGADMAAAAADAASLRAEYAENRAAAATDLARRLSQWDAENRACLNDVVQLSISLHEVKALLEYDRGLVKGLATVAQNAERMGGLVPTYDLLMAKAEYEATAKRIVENERLLARLEEEMQAAKERQAAHLRHRPEPPSEDAAVRDLRDRAVVAQETVLRGWEAQQGEFVLRAPFDGVVVEIPGRAGEVELQRPGEGLIRGPGEFVLAGEPILAIAEGRPTEIVAYADGDQATKLHPGLEVELATTAPMGQRARSIVIAVSPTVQRLPERLWTDPRAPQWGRPFLVMIPPDMTLNAGDLVMVRKRWSGVRPVTPEKGLSQTDAGRTVQH